MTRSIDADELKKHKFTTQIRNGLEIEDIEVVPVASIDNAPTIPLPDFKEGYKQAIHDGKTNFSRQQGEWIKDIQGDIICKNCGFECLYNEEGMYSLGRYCHHCGADMRSGQNNKCNVSYLHQDSITKTDTKI